MNTLDSNTDIPTKNEQNMRVCVCFSIDFNLGFQNAMVIFLNPIGFFWVFFWQLQGELGILVEWKPTVS